MRRFRGILSPLAADCVSNLGQVLWLRAYRGTIARPRPAAYFRISAAASLTLPAAVSTNWVSSQPVKHAGGPTPVQYAVPGANVARAPNRNGVTVLRTRSFVFYKLIDGTVTPVRFTASPARPRRRQSGRAAGASFSPFFTLLGGGLFGGNLEGPDEAAAAEWHAPGVVEAVALIGILQRVGRHGVFQLSQWRIVDVLVAADVVGFGHAAGGDLGERSGGEAGRAAVNVAVLHGEFDGRRLHLDDVGEQVRGLTFGEGDERGALFGRGAAIHDEHGDGGVDGAMDIAECVLGADHAHHAETGEVDALPGSIINLPAKDGFLAVDLDFPVGEARAGVDIGRAGFHVVAGQAAGGKAGGKRCGSGRAKRGGGTEQFHPS